MAACEHASICSNTECPTSTCTTSLLCDSGLAPTRRFHSQKTPPHTCAQPWWLWLQAQCKQSWAELLERFALLCPMFRAAARGLAVLDCLQSLAAVATAPNCCRPEIVDDDPRLAHGGCAGTAEDGVLGKAAPDGPPPGAEAGAPGDEIAGSPGDVPGGCASAPASDGAEALIEIREGRAPLLDDMLPQGAVPNDVVLRGDGLRAMCISGPNMGGKSSYMCQVCSTCDRPRCD